MKLNIGERVTLLGAMPEMSNFETMATVDKLNAALVISEEEIDEFEFKRSEKNLTWNPKGEEQIEIEISDKGITFLFDRLKQLDKDDKLTMNRYLLLKRFREEHSEE